MSVYQARRVGVRLLGAQQVGRGWAEPWPTTWAQASSTAAHHLWGGRGARGAQRARGRRGGDLDGRDARAPSGHGAGHWRAQA